MNTHEHKTQYYSPKLKEQEKRTKVIFFKLGGTWDMIFREGQKIGSGNLDDNELFKIQNEFDYFNENPQKRAAVERKLVTELYKKFCETKTEYEVGEHLSSWAKNEIGEKIYDFI